MQKLVAVVVIVVLFTFTAFIHESEGEGEKTRLIQKNATLQQISGWVESNWNVSDEPNIMANLSIPICLNNTNIINFKLSIDIVDSDSEHAETDQGSDPDTVTIIVSGNNLTETQKGVTPLSYYPGFTSDNESQGLFYLSQEWLIQVNVDCCGGKPKSGSLYFSLYKDHGFAYTINV